MAPSAFFRLHPHLQHAIVHELGWRDLRPVQDLTTDVVLEGANAVVLAPTAGGKTEAAIFPLLSQILVEERQPVAALYICPIRALLNNQEERIGRYAAMVGLEAFKWHGDVSDARKQKFRERPAHLLMTTPESLEVMLMSSRTDARQLFANLSTVVIDEVHAFAADDRGAHLIALLERLSRLSNRDIQRIGLSATVGNPALIAEWLQGSSKRESKLVDPPRLPANRRLRVEYFSALEVAAPAMARQAEGKKSLLFVESRAGAEKVAHALEGRGVEVLVHHSAVSRADRARAEAQFTTGENVAVVCTATLELGIDVGDLDQVIQYDSPRSVSSWLQRLGRTGRRPGTPSVGTLVCTSSEAMLQAIAVLRLAHHKWIEDVQPPRRSLPVLAHQILALTLQEGGVSRHQVSSWIGKAFAFQAVTEQEIARLIDTMVSREILYESDGRLSLGQRGERLYGMRNFFELYAVFSAPPILAVRHGRQEIGQLQATFVQGHPPEKGPLFFRLSGKSWVMVGLDWDMGVVFVEPADGGRVPSWLGAPGLLSFEICQEIRQTLLEAGPEAEWLSERADDELKALRAEYGELLRSAPAPLEDRGAQFQWHTFAGGKTNRLLAVGLEELTGQRWTTGNLSLRGVASGMSEARAALRALITLDWDRLACQSARGLARGRLSKFQPCLPEEEEDRLLADLLLDVEGTRRFLANLATDDQRTGLEPSIGSKGPSEHL